MSKNEKWIPKHPSNPIKIGKRKNQGVYIPFLKKMMYNMGKADNQHSYFVEKTKVKVRTLLRAKVK